VQQRTGDRELLLHALAERAGHVVAPVPQAEEPQVALDALGAHRRVEAVQPAEEIEVQGGRQLVVESRRLGQDADSRADVVGRVADVEPIDRCGPLGRLDERCEHADRGRLAGTVRPEQAEHLPATHGQIDATDRPAIPEPSTEARGLECEIGRPVRPPLSRYRRHRGEVSRIGTPSVVGLLRYSKDATIGA
jgi:hypothetical protein